MTNGDCDLCGSLTPFEKRSGHPYLECHHIEPLTHGSKENLSNVVALFPICHRKVDILNLEVDRKRLNSIASSRFEDLYLVTSV
jgi:5-methylcytosine-specific restriction protein A